MDSMESTRYTVFVRKYLAGAFFFPPPPEEKSDSWHLVTREERECSVEKERKYSVTGVYKKERKMNPFEFFLLEKRRGKRERERE